MKAILVKENRHLVWTEVPDPIVQPRDVLVRIEAAAVNRADLMQREGNYPPPPGCPEWMGLEIAGTIVEIGSLAREKSDWQVGDKVCALLGGGGYAQYANVAYDMLMPIPKNCAMEEAAAMPEAFATAYLNLFLEGKAAPGDTVLVTGGNSGLASVIIPMANAFGMRTLTTVRSPEKARAISHLHADRVIDTSSEDLVRALKQEEDEGHPVAVAIDCIGGEIMGKCLLHLKHGARWIVIAALNGAQTQIDLRNIYVRNVRIVGSTLRSRAPEVKAQILASLVREIWPMVESGKIRPTIYSVLPITQAEQAQDLLYQSRSVGKVVLTVEH